MEMVLLGLNVLLILFSVVFAFVLYQLMKGVYVFLRAELQDTEYEYFLFRLSPRVVSVLFVICFLALVL